MIHLDVVQIGDDIDAWRAAGFRTDDDAITVGATAIECSGDGRSPAWRLWADDKLPGDLDGIPITLAPSRREPHGTTHPNRVVEIDHVVLQSPDLDRTTEAFERLGTGCRRIREVPGSEPAMQQRFFRFGPVILELVGTATPRGDGPASIWGFAFTVDDIDVAAAHLGSACSAPKDAVQPGRRIATVRTRDLGISLPVAFMSEPPPR